MALPNLKDNKAIQLLLQKKQESEQYRKVLDEMKSNMREVLIINEVFSTVQCEGKSMGMPTIFIRTYGCNLRCGFANPDGTRGCDTPYTWLPSATTADDVNRYTPSMLVDEIMQYPVHNHWVLTGWEPLLQGDKFIPVCEEYKKRTGEYPYVEFETNGTVIPSEALQPYVGHYNVSLKLENSNATEKTGYHKDEYEYNWNTEKRRVIEKPVQWFTAEPKAYFKFVIDRNLEVLEEVKGLQKRFNIPNTKVWLMPEGNSEEDIRASSCDIVEVCKEEGYRFSTRLHILLWGFRRWV